VNGSPALSVVVATTGRPTWRRLVDSILHSVDQAAGVRVEVLLVWQSSAPPPHVERVRTLDAFPVSLSYARNRGLLASRGDLVAFLDDDEVAETAYIANLIQAFAAHPEAAAVFGAVSPLDHVGIPYCVVEGDGQQSFHGRRAPWRVGTGGNMAFRRSILLRMGGFDLQLGVATPGLSGEDTDIILRMLRDQRTLIQDSQIVVRHPTKTFEEVLASRYPYGFGTGRVARVNRDAKVAAQYCASLAQALVASHRSGSRRRRQESWQTFHGYLAGGLKPTRWLAPVAALTRLPEPIFTAFPGQPSSLAVQFDGQPRFDYESGGRVLHVHVHPDDRLLSSYTMRERLRLSGFANLPRLRAVIVERDALWAVEDEVRGQPVRPGRLSQWLPLATAWAVELARTEFGTAKISPDSRAERDRLLDLTPNTLRKAVEQALDESATCPRVLGHGNLQPTNLLLSPSGLTVMGWERFSESALPGQDLMLLHATARTGRPDARLLLDVVADPAHALRATLASAGLPERQVKAAVVAAAAVWAATESVNRSYLGVARSVEPVFGPLLERLAQTLS
jgi:hypothetical protein